MLKDNRTLLALLHYLIAVFTTVLCVFLFSLAVAAPVNKASPETLARKLAKAYDRDDFRSIQSLTSAFDETLTILFDSGALERVVRLVQVVTPAASKWRARALSSADIEPILIHLADWQTLEALARNQFQPTEIKLFAHQIAKDEMPLHISVEGDEKSYINIYRSFNSTDAWKEPKSIRQEREWIGEVPQHVILSPGLNRLILEFSDGYVAIGLTLDGRSVHVDDLHSELSNYYDINTEACRKECLARLRGRYEDDYEDYSRVCKDESARVRFEFISLIHQRYPTSSVLQRKANGVPSLEVPRPPMAVFCGPPGIGGSSPLFIGTRRTAYRKIQIESEPTGASISIDGQPFGTTPRAILLSLKGPPNIRMSLAKPGYLEMVTEINLTEPATAIHASLNPIP